MKRWSFNAIAGECAREVHKRKEVYPRHLGQRGWPRSETEANELIAMMEQAEHNHRWLDRLRNACLAGGRVEVFISEQGNLEIAR